MTAARKSAERRKYVTVTYSGKSVKVLCKGESMLMSRTIKASEFGVPLMQAGMQIIVDSYPLPFTIIPEGFVSIVMCLQTFPGYLQHSMVLSRDQVSKRAKGGEVRQRIADWLIKLARRIDPPNRAYLAFMNDRMMEGMITGSSFVKVTAIDTDQVSELPRKGKR